MEEIIEDIELVNIVRFAVIDANGDILWIGECPEEEVSLQATEVGQTVRTDVPANVTDESHYYKNGAYKAYPAKPGSWSVFNYTTETWIDTRSSDRNLDFDRRDYTIEPLITVSGTTLSYAAFTATRDNGVYAESKAKAAGSVTFAGSPVLIAYSWDANTVATYASYAAMNSSPRRFLIGEFKASGVFVPASLLVDGGRVATNTVGTPQLAPLAVTSTELALAAVGKEHLQVDSVVASKIGITDLTNIIPDSEMKDDEAWSNPGNWTRGNNPATSSFTTPGHLSYNAATLTSGYSNDTRSKKFPVEAGREYFVKYHTYSTSNHGVWGRVHWFNAQDGEITPYATVGADTAASGLREYRQVVKPPANAKYGEMRFYVNHAQTTGTVQVSSLMCRVMSNGELIVDGAVKTNHLDSDTIDTRHLKAGVITASALSIMDLTNLVPDSEFQDVRSWWGIDSSGTGVFQLRTTGSNANAKTEGDVVYWSSRNTANSNLEFRSGFIPVTEGDVLQIGGQMFRSGGTKMRAFIGSILYAKDKTTVISGGYRSDIVVNGTASTTAFRSAEIVIPAGVWFIRWRGYVYGADTDSNVVFASPSLRFKSKGELIVDGTIEGKHLKADSISVRELTIGGFDDIILNTDLRVIDGWDLVNTGVAHVTSGFPTGTTAPGLFSFSPITSGEALARWRTNNRISVKPGERYVIGAQFRASGTTPNFRTRMVIWQYRADGSYYGAQTPGVIYLTNTAYTDIYREFSIPDEVTHITVGFGRTADTNASGTGYVQFPSLRKKITGEMIVNGEVVTDHIADDAIVGVYTWAWSSGTGGSATLTFPTSTKHRLLIIATAVMGNTGNQYGTVQIRITGAATQTYEYTMGGPNAPIARRTQSQLIRNLRGVNGTITVTITKDNDTALYIEDLTIIEYKR